MKCFVILEETYCEDSDGGSVDYQVVVGVVWTEKEAKLYEDPKKGITYEETEFLNDHLSADY